MRNFWENLLGRRLWALFMKELQQLRRNRRLVVILVIPPTMNLILFGFALNPEVTNLRLGIVDESRTSESRELVSAFVESRSFQVSSYYASSDSLGRDLSAGRIDAGLVIPFDYARKRARHETVNIQFLVDAVNANTAAIASGYAGRIVNALNQKYLQEEQQQSQGAIAQNSSEIQLAQTTSTANASSSAANLSSSSATSPISGDSSQIGGTAPATQVPNGSLISRAVIVPRVALLYNPGLKNSWFIVTGLIGTLLVLQGSLVSAASMVREKEIGTIEQLLMTPAEASEIIIAKVAPILLLLTADIGLALTVGYLVFGVPVRGSLLLLFFAGSLCVLSGIGIGTLIATFTRSQQQAQLMGFFVNPPIALLSGATTPVEAMPKWMQPFTLLNPVRHFATISRGVMLKGVGIETLYPNVLALVCFAAVLVGVSAWRFRKQLG